MVLFCCATYYQLLNAINIKLSLYSDQRADLVLMDSTRFGSHIEKLKKHHIFDHITFLEGSWERDRKYKRASANLQRKMMKNPEKLVAGDIVYGNYTDYFMGGQTPFYKIIYYTLCRAGVHPNVYLFEDGLYSYVQDYLKDCDKDGMDHDKYKNDSLKKKTMGIFLYGGQDLYCGSPAIPALEIPKIRREDLAVYQDVFGYEELPKEKYIFLEEGMFQDKLLCADVAMLDRISEIVGKENIIVKRHPRCKIDRFSPRGYKVVENSGYPWEVTLMSNDLSDKVLLTISSTASITAPLVLNKQIDIIQLFMMKPYGAAGPHIGEKNYRAFHKKLCQYLNRQTKQFFVPSSLGNLEEILTYLENRRRIDVG